MKARCVSWLNRFWDFLLDCLSLRKLRVNNLLWLLLMYGCRLRTPRTQFYKCTQLPLGLVGLLTCLNASRLAVQFCMIFFFRVLFKNTQEFSNFLYTVPQPKPTEVIAKAPTVFNWCSDLSRIPYGLVYWVYGMMVGCLTTSVPLEWLSCCNLVTVE